MRSTRVSLSAVAKCSIIIEYLLLWSIGQSVSHEIADTYKINSFDQQIIEEARKSTSDAKSNAIIYEVDDDCYDKIRLPNHVKPERYSLAIEPEMSDFTFKSAVIVGVEVNLEKVGVAETILSNKIVLHSLGLDILHAAYVKENGEIIEVAKVCESPKFEVIRLDLRSNLSNGKGNLFIQYRGEIRDDMKGFYRSKYTSFSGETRYHATTQFQATDARRALPCFDEPAFKAIFDVTLIVPKDRLALANMHVISVHDLGDKNAVLFASTPIMSTYLLAFIIGEFDYVEGTNRGRPIRVYSSPGKGELGRFALDVALKSLPFLEDYFNIEFPLQKLDLVAIPDFSPGAMENWGLITYREFQLLIDDENSSLWQKAIVAETVAHELSHQWFGNLVTMSWWDDLWLNEGFATYMQYFVLSELYPQYNSMEKFVFDSHAVAMSEDAKHSTHPVQASVNNPEEIDAIFDNISYNKGASIVGLLKEHLSDDVFRAGLEHYLRHYSYRNTETNDLWESMEFISGKPIREMMQSWTNQAGYPYLDVSISRRILDVFKTKLTINLNIVQRKFTEDGLMGPANSAQEKSKWIVPISMITSDGISHLIQKDVLSDKKSKIHVDNQHGEWIKLNANFKGFYCVNYSKELREALYPAIKSKQLSAVDRYNLLADAHVLTLAGKLSARELLQMIDYYKDEDNGSVVGKLIDVYLSMLGFVKSANSRDKFKEFGRQLFKSIYYWYGWNRKHDETYSTTIARQSILMTCLITEYKPAIEESLSKFELILYNKQLVDPSIRGAIYYAATQFGDEDEFDNLFELYRGTSFSGTRQSLALALCHVEERSRVYKVIQWILNSSDVRDSDRDSYLISMAASDVGRQVLWDIMDDNFSRFRDQFGMDSFIKIIKAIGSSLIKSSSEKESTKKVDNFFVGHHFDLESYSKVGVSIISDIKAYVKQEMLVSKSIEQFLHEYKSNDSKRRIKQQPESMETMEQLKSKIDKVKIDFEIGFEVDGSSYDLQAIPASGA